MMDRVQFAILKDNHTFLRNNIRFTQAVIAGLVRTEILVTMQDEETLYGWGRVDKYTFLIEKLRERGHDAFDLLCTVLVCNGCPGVAKKLKSLELQRKCPGKRNPFWTIEEAFTEIMYDGFLDLCEKELEFIRNKKQREKKRDLILGIVTNEIRRLPASDETKTDLTIKLNDRYHKSK